MITGECIVVPIHASPRRSRRFIVLCNIGYHVLRVNWPEGVTSVDIERRATGVSIVTVHSDDGIGIDAGDVIVEANEGE
jgi:hypothetical protein